MQFNKKLFCHWDHVRFVTEEHLKQEDGTFLTLSVTNGNELEYMIFLGKDDSTSEYEVRVYKCKSTDKYVPHKYDDVKRFEENDEYDSFFFDEYENAHDFADWIGYRHPEYKARPVREITTD